jgi:hypothetical protein
MDALDFWHLYGNFDAPISAFDCGDRCSPYNERSVPFCCDTRHAVPTAYEPEWQFLLENTNLWHAYQSGNQEYTAELRRLLPDGQVLIECLGHRLCQRSYRSVVCRSFPFFPYITRQGEFVGLSYYWEYEDRCWVISNLHVITQEYRSQFLGAYEELFRKIPDELNNFRAYSTRMRRVFGRRNRAIPLLHRNGFCYKVAPGNGRMRRVESLSYPKFGMYKIAASLPFSDEIM